VRRILVTGSRRWNDVATIRDVLRAYAGTDTVIVHGAANGADAIAEQVATSLGLKTERVAADWERCAPDCPPGHLKQRRGDGRPYCPTAGFRRNQRMVDLGAFMCHVFPLGTSAGTRDCVRRAKAAGIPIFEHAERLGDS
jgi:hypothetical protein